MKKNYSLRRHLLLWISLPIIVATLLAILASYFSAKHEVEEIYDAQLVHSAKVLLQLTQHEIKEDEEFDLGIEDPSLQHKYERNFGYRIWFKDKIISQSPNTLDFKDFEAPPKFSDRTVNGKEWRFFVFVDPQNNIKIEVSEIYDIRYELILDLILSLILPALAFLPVILIIIWMGIKRVLKPVISISTEVNQRGSNDLSPILKTSLPFEISPLIVALNRLFQRIEDSFKREKQFTDNAAHELRTPLAAMKTQTQVLLKKLNNSKEHSEDLHNLNASIDRASNMVDQLLSFSRLQTDEIKFEAVNLSSLCESVLRDLSLHSLKKSIELEADIVPNLKVKGHNGSLEIMLRNLVGNSIKFTPFGGKISVSLYQEDKLIVLCITDTGIGIKDSDKDKVFERFYRANKNKEGTGLGLAMAKWVIDTHGADISLSDNQLSGLVVKVTIKVL